jgi:hypothetical protein
MIAGATRAGPPPAASGPGADPWLIAVLVAVAVFMEVLDTTIANVALRYIAGGLGVSEDEVSWVVTTYLVANATIVMCYGHELSDQVVRPQGSFPHMPWIIHPELSALRNGRES